MKPIAVTVGEPAGIGPDIIIMLAQSEILRDIVVIGNKQVLQQRAQQLQLPLTLIDYSHTSRIDHLSQLLIEDVPLAAPVTCGTAQAIHAQHVLQTLDIAIAGCLAKQFTALVTGPINKTSINQAGIDFTGHTEYLARATHTPQVVMMLVADNLRVALATTHIPLAEVSNNIKQATLETIITTIDNTLRKQWHITLPSILVCGLNPHAGEGGYLGREEIDEIMPALTQLQQQGIDCRGPYPADTVFAPDTLATADVILAMYHDQGLPVLKYAGFGHAVNVTLGLPIIRTSVDHGTALAIAGTGKASPGSLQAAIKLARDLAHHG